MYIPILKKNAPQRPNVLPEGDLPDGVERVAEEERGEVHDGALALAPLVRAVVVGVGVC